MRAVAGLRGQSATVPWPTGQAPLRRVAPPEPAAEHRCPFELHRPGRQGAHHARYWRRPDSDRLAAPNPIVLRKREAERRDGRRTGGVAVDPYERRTDRSTSNPQISERSPSGEAFGNGGSEGAAKDARPAALDEILGRLDVIGERLEERKCPPGRT